MSLSVIETPALWKFCRISAFHVELKNRTRPIEPKPQKPRKHKKTMFLKTSDKIQSTYHETWNSFNSRSLATGPHHVAHRLPWRPVVGRYGQRTLGIRGSEGLGGCLKFRKKKKKPCIHSDIKCRFRGVHFTSYQLNTRLLRPEDLPLYVGGPKAQAWENFFFQIGSHDLRSQNGNDATKCCFFRTNNIFGKHKHEDFCEKMLISDDILNV